MYMLTGQISLDFISVFLSLFIAIIRTRVLSETCDCSQTSRVPQIRTQLYIPFTRTTRNWVNAREGVPETPEVYRCIAGEALHQIRRFLTTRRYQGWGLSQLIATNRRRCSGRPPLCVVSYCGELGQFRYPVSGPSLRTSALFRLR